jgi:hypothetical protein
MSEKWVDRIIQIITMWVLILAVLTIPVFYSVLKRWDNSLIQCATLVQDPAYGR